MKDQEFEVKKIRSQYASQPHTELDTLKVLDTRVRLPAIVFGGVLRQLGGYCSGYRHESDYDGHWSTAGNDGHDGSRYCDGGCGTGDELHDLPDL